MSFNDQELSLYEAFAAIVGDQPDAAYEQQILAIHVSDGAPGSAYDGPGPTAIVGQAKRIESANPPLAGSAAVLLAAAAKAEVIAGPALLSRVFASDAILAVSGLSAVAARNLGGVIQRR